MVIDRVKKLVILIHKEEYLDFITNLKNLSIVEIQPTRQNTSEIKFYDFDFDQVNLNIAKIEAAISVFKKYIDYSPFDRVENENFSLSLGQIEGKQKFILPYLEKVEKAEASIRLLEQEISELESKKNILENFAFCEIELNKIRTLKTSSIGFYKGSTKNFNKFLSEVRKQQFFSIICENRVKNTVYFVCLFHNSIKDSIEKIFNDYDIVTEHVMKECATDSVKDGISYICQIINLKREKINGFKADIKKIYEICIKDLILLYVKYIDIIDFLNVEKTSANTASFKIITCWIPEKNISLFKEFSKNFKFITVLYFEPSDNDDVPVFLSNNKIVQPYEFVTTMFSYPKPNSVDPTVFLAPYFTVFFALCLSDVVYGFFLIIFWFFLRTKVEIHNDMQKLVSLLKYLGLFTVILGFFSNSFLGMEILERFNFLKKLVFFDPLQRPIDFLKITFLLGLVQILFGMTIKLFRSFKDKNILEILDNFFLQLFILFFAPVGYKFIFPKDVSENIVNISFKIMSILLLIVVLLQTRKIKSFFLRILALPGIFLLKIYSILGYCADILSYSRILALALAGTAISKTINLLTLKMFANSFLGIKFIPEPIIAPFVFLAGHLFNFLVSSLGAYVHAARLQYLEFFSKFFEGGGRPIRFFKPAVYTRK